MLPDARTVLVTSTARFVGAVTGTADPVVGGLTVGGVDGRISSAAVVSDGGSFNARPSSVFGRNRSAGNSMSSAWSCIGRISCSSHCRFVKP
jgi:hypothetical protein